MARLAACAAPRCGESVSQRGVLVEKLAMLALEPMVGPRPSSDELVASAQIVVVEMHRPRVDARDDPFLRAQRQRAAQPTTEDPGGDGVPEDVALMRPPG